jgi:SAM-dependent methyltransferase
MTTPAPQALIDAAEGYESLLVPALFEPWPTILLSAANVSEGDSVLDVACGTGVLAREAITRVGITGSVAGTDPNLGMLAVAERIEPAVDWREGVAESIPFSDDAVDVVASQFGFMFFTDKLAAAREMLRVAKPAGRVVVAVWDALEKNPAYAAEVELLERLAGSEAADCVRAPFALGDAQRFAEPFQDIATEVSITTHSSRGRFPTLEAMLEADLRGWLPILGVELEEPLIERILTEAKVALGDYVQADGSVEFETSAHILGAICPD